MLKYFIDTCQILLLAAVMVGMILRLMHNRFFKPGKICGIVGVSLGIVGAGVMAYLKNATKLIDTSMCNLINFTAAVGVLILFIIFTSLSNKLKTPGRIIASVLGCALIVSALLYALPDIISYPYIVLRTEKSVFSTEFIYKMIGAVLGIVFAAVTCVSVNKASDKLTKGQLLFFVYFMLSFNAVRQIFACIRILNTKRIIPPGSDFLGISVFDIVKFSSDYDTAFLYGTLAILLALTIVLIVRSYKQNETYNNPAEKRKILRKWQSVRHWSAAIICCLILMVLNLTWFTDITNTVVELSPVEESRVENGNVYVTFEQVADGHLHRFAYTTKNNVQIRFIVIKKPNSSAYGIGLDACDICGETGYYEKDGQVVCKLCDVVMNINTIGFKGGCNPIVIPYTIENGNIIVPIDGLTEYESEFK